MAQVDEATGLLQTVSSSRLGRASVRKTYANIIISILGSGVLGLPFTYRYSGWTVATCAIAFSGALAYYSMVLLVTCRDRLLSTGHEFVQTYPDLGFHTYGKYGRQAVEITLLISQIGCCVAYLIFIGHNLSSVFFQEPRYLTVILFLALLEIILAWVRSLSTLAPFSIFANICNVLAMAIVIKTDASRFHRSSFSSMNSFTDLKGLPFALGVCIYCYEGFGMTLSLQSSMKKPHKFKRVLGLAFLLITLAYLVFGFAGYAAFGEKTQEIITLNLDSRAWSTNLVKLGLSIGLFFTFPVMMYPVYEIFEGRLLLNEWFQKQAVASPRLLNLVINTLRGVIVIFVALIAAAIPGFGTFISLVGSTVCALLAFVFPALLHYQLCRDCSGRVLIAVDIILVVFGVAFAAYGTYDTCSTIFQLKS